MTDSLNTLKTPFILTKLYLSLEQPTLSIFRLSSTILIFSMLANPAQVLRNSVQ